MDNVLDIAQYIFNRYKAISNENIDEMKLHKLLYFSQRESFAITNEPLFSDVFEGWRYGPVCRTLRENYTVDGIINFNPQHISDKAEYIVNNIIMQYGYIESWKLSQLSHQEISWKNSRRGLSENENGNTPLDNGDIQKDSEKIRPYDHIWGMYLDEFETEEA